MSEEDLELLITTDDPGEDTLEEDTFHQPQACVTGQTFTATTQDDDQRRDD